MTRRGVVALVAGGAVAAAAAWAVFFSPWLRVRTVSVSVVAAPKAAWQDPTLRQRVEQSLPEMLGRPLATVDTSAVMARLSALRGVAAADVRRGWPTTVAVIVRPRVPVAVFAEPASNPPRWQLLDRTSAVVAEVSKPLPGWVVLGVSPASPGGRAAMSVWASLPGNLRSQVALMSAADPTSDAAVELTLRDGASVRWGADERAARKAEVLQALLRYKAKVYDVSSPDVPTTRK